MSDRNKSKAQNPGGDAEINPHMPQYIIKPPWYLNQTENSLKHQKAQVEVTKLPISNYTLKGVVKNDVYKFRKGACENCGAMTHKKIECMERPRKIGAKFSGKDFAGDEYINEVPMDYEGKRDRWNGYDPNSFSRIMMEYQRLEEEKKRIKNEELGKGNKIKEDDFDESGSSEDENKLLTNEVPEEFKVVAEIFKPEEGDPSNTNQQTTDEDVVSYLSEMRKDSSKRSIRDIPKDILYTMCTSKSLHIGTDYSKYLINLALNSAYYDGKSRSMRENPNPGSLEIHSFKGDNYIRTTGDTLKLLELENFIRDANEKNKELNLNNVAMPSQAELFHKYLNNTKAGFRSNVLQKIISKYGGEEHLKVPQDILKDDFDPEEYIDNTDGHSRKKVLLVKSIYPEDVFINNHTSVWGSYYHDKFGWGYKCCQSFERNSTCKGEQGLAENKKLIKQYEEKINEDIRRAKQKVKDKEDMLRKRNLREESSGAFNEMFEKMERYEQTGRINFNNKNEYLSKKTERE
jgi:pre-mRNA-processing factor SLU7